MNLKMSLRLDLFFYQTEVLRSVVLRVEVFAGWQLWLVQGLGVASWKCWQRISKFSIFLYIFSCPFATFVISLYRGGGGDRKTKV